jgi:O-antigen ligase
MTRAPAAPRAPAATLPVWSTEQRGRRAAQLGLLSLSALAVCVGLGDIADRTPLTWLLLNAVRALLLVPVALALLFAFQQRRWPRFPEQLALPTAVWLGVLLASALLAPSHRPEAVASLARPASLGLLAWAVTELCCRRHTWLRVLRGLALGGLVVALVALAEATPLAGVEHLLGQLHDGEIPIGDVPRVAATLSHPNEAAMLLELTLPLLVAAAWSASTRRGTVVLALAAIASMLALVLTFSRAGIVAALLALGLLALLATPRRNPRQLSTIGAVALVVPLALAWTSVVDAGLDRRLLAGLDESSSLQPPRTRFWSVAVEMLRDEPLLGVGPDNFRWRFADYSGVDADNLGIHAHDQYLETLADTGVLGFLSFAWLLAALIVRSIQCLRQSPREDRPWRAALLAGLSAWLVHAVVDDFERFWPTSVAFWLIAGLSLSHWRARSRLSD